MVSTKGTARRIIFRFPVAVKPLRQGVRLTYIRSGIMNSAAQLSRVRGFDGLRGVAVTFVFAEHRIVGGLGLGGLGVWLFFALSGYLIIRILHSQRNLIESGTVTVKQEILRFWKRRALRIFPLYYGVLLLVCGRLLEQKTGLLEAGIPWYIGYLSNFYIAYIAHGWSTFSHLWSLSVEQQFYLLAAPAFLGAPAASHRRLLGVMLLIALMAVVASIFGSGNAFSLYLSPLPNFGLMAIGGILALEERHLRWPAQRWTKILWAGCLTIAVVVALERFGSHTSPLLAALKFLSAYLFAFCFIGYVSARQESALTGFLALPALAYIGTVSYGFYIFHLFVPGYPSVARVLHIPALPVSIQESWFVVQFAVTVAIASASWHFLEKPILRFKEKSFTSRAVAGTPPTRDKMPIRAERRDYR